MYVSILDGSFSWQAVDLAVVVEALFSDRDDDGHRFVVRRLAEAEISADIPRPS